METSVVGGKVEASSIPLLISVDCERELEVVEDTGRRGGNKKLNTGKEQKREGTNLLVRLVDKKRVEGGDKVCAVS